MQLGNMMSLGEIIPVSYRAQFRDPMTAAQAAQEFEAMLIAELLATARQAGELFSEESSQAGADEYTQIAERHLADALAKTEAFGFARLLLHDLPAR